MGVEVMHVVKQESKTTSPNFLVQNLVTLRNTEAVLQSPCALNAVFVAQCILVKCSAFQ